MKRNERTGSVIGALTVKEEDELMLITVAGQMVRIAVRDVREAGRNTQGVKLIELSHGDRLQAIAPVISEANEAAAEGTENLPGLGTQPPPGETPPPASPPPPQA